MGRNVALLMLVAVVMLSGCVAKSDFLAKVSELDGVKKDLASLDAKQKGTEKSLADEKKKSDDLTAKVADLEKQKAALQQENANIKSTLELSRSQLSKEVVALKNKIDENSARIKVLEDELAAKNTEIAQLKAQADQLAQEKERAIASVKNTYDSLLTELKQEIKEGEIQITQLKDKLTVNMVDKILFDSGSAVIKKNGEKVLDRVGEILKGVTGRQIKVEGHTDNVPISSRLAERFPSNWELSTARATMVVRYLQGRGVNPGVLSAEGYAEFRPVSPNDTDEGKAANRRIEIVLIPQEVNK
ncbi:MAG: OmpA family protein [Nitrospirota bacterium]